MSVCVRIRSTTHQTLTTWSRVLPEKLTSPQLVKKFPEFYAACRFNTTFTSKQRNQLLPPHPISWRFILILYFHLCLGLSSGVFPSGLHTKTLYASFLPPTHATHTHTPHPSHSSWSDYPDNGWWGAGLQNISLKRTLYNCNAGIYFNWQCLKRQLIQT
jgi:hypothetical protein